MEFSPERKASSFDLFPEIRQSLDKRILDFLPSPQAELLSGIILGNKKQLPYDLRLDLRDTSTLHIVVVSGQNLTLLSLFIMNLSGVIKKKSAIVLSIGLIIFYTLLTGAQVPVLRASIMVILSFLAQIFGRKEDGLRVLVITGGGMLLVNPLWINDLSFQLSFLATFGVIVVSPILIKPLYFLPEIVKQDLAITTAAQFMVMPILIQNFHQLSLAGIPANLFVSWTIPFTMVLGIVMLFLSFISSFLAQVAGFFVNILLTYFIYIVHFFASFDFSWIYVGKQAWIVWVGYYVVLSGIMLSLNYGKKEHS